VAVEPSVFPETPDDEEDVAAPEDDDQKDFSWEERHGRP